MSEEATPIASEVLIILTEAICVIALMSVGDAPAGLFDMVVSLIYQTGMALTTVLNTVDAVAPGVTRKRTSVPLISTV